jgi:hypothetical protein
MTTLNKGLSRSRRTTPGRAASLSSVAEAAKRGLDPNRWFNHVELVTADKIGSETVN